MVAVVPLKPGHERQPPALEQERQPAMDWGDDSVLDHEPSMSPQRPPP